MEGKIKVSKLLTLKTEVWFRFASPPLPEECYEHSLILINLLQFTHISKDAILVSPQGDFFGHLPKLQCSKCTALKKLSEVMSLCLGIFKRFVIQCCSKKRPDGCQTENIAQGL